MKSTDIAMIILIASISVGVAYAAVSSIPFLKAPDEPVKVKTVQQYETAIEEPDERVFNKEAINPTVDVTIGGESSSGL